MLVECRISNVDYGLKTPWTVSKSSFSVYLASPKIEKKSENRAARNKREHARRGTLCGPTGEVGNEQLRYSTVNSKEISIPIKRKYCTGLVFLRWKNNASVQILMWKRVWGRGQGIQMRSHSSGRYKIGFLSLPIGIGSPWFFERKISWFFERKISKTKKSKTNFCWNFEVWAVQPGIHLAELGKSFLNEYLVLFAWKSWCRYSRGRAFQS